MRHFLTIFKALWTFFTITPCDSNWLEVVQRVGTSGTISSAWWQIGTNVTGKWTIIMNGLETASSRALWKICHHLLSKCYSEKPRQHIKKPTALSRTHTTVLLKGCYCCIYNLQDYRWDMLYCGEPLTYLFKATL